MMFLICFIVKSQQYDVHVPWKLEGVNERIDTYRKGKAASFCSDNISSEPAELDIRLANHAFNFGVSMTKKDPLKVHHIKTCIDKEFQKFLIKLP